MMNKNIKNILALSLVLVLGTRCTGDFEEINTNPNDPITAPGALLLPDVQRIASNIIYNSQVGGDQGACWAQQWSKVQYNDEERYQPRQTSIEGLWTQIFADVLADAKTMEKLAISEENPALQGAALVMQAYGFSVLTDMYGSIPFTEALKSEEGNFTPAYDNQEVVYDGILAMLDQANTLLATGDGSIRGDVDLMYDGDIEKWQKFANSLKFRALMRISGKRNVSADLTALLTRPMFTSNADNAQVNYEATQPNANPIYETIVFGTRGEYKVSDVMVDYLADNNDPRLPVYAQRNNANEYRGKPAGIADVPSEEWSYENVSALGTKYLDPLLPGVFMSYSELEFLMAEAAAEGYIAGGDAAAETHYLAGIDASMDFNGIADHTAFLAGINIDYNPAMGLEQIGYQKWVSLYCQGLEAWTEWRRTGYPELSPAIDALSPSIPRRFTYPASEQTTNSGAYKAAVGVQGADELTTKVWWMN